MATFTERLSGLQAAKCLKKDLCAELGISIMTYYRYERGEREPSLSTLVAIADYFDVSLDYLAGRTDKTEINR